MRQQFAAITAVVNYEVHSVPIIAHLIPRGAKKVSGMRLGNFGGACNGVQEVFESRRIGRGETGANETRNGPGASYFEVYEVDKPTGFNFFGVGANGEAAISRAIGVFRDRHAVEPETWSCIGGFLGKNGNGKQGQNE